MIYFCQDWLSLTVTLLVLRHPCLEAAADTPHLQMEMETDGDEDSVSSQTVGSLRWGVEGEIFLVLNWSL